MNVLIYDPVTLRPSHTIYVPRSRIKEVLRDGIGGKAAVLYRNECLVNSRIEISDVTEKVKLRRVVPHTWPAVLEHEKSDALARLHREFESKCRSASGRGGVAAIRARKAMEAAGRLSGGASPILDAEAEERGITSDELAAIVREKAGREAEALHQFDRKRRAAQDAIKNAETAAAVWAAFEEHWGPRPELET